MKQQPIYLGMILRLHRRESEGDSFVHLVNLVCGVGDESDLLGLK